MPSQPQQLTLYSRLAQATLRDSQALPYRLWTVCRFLDFRGRGWLTVQEVRKGWPQSYQTIRTVLKRGHSLFWHFDKNKIWLTGLEKLSISFGTIPGYAVHVPFEKALSIKTFKAACYASFFSGRGRVISREKLKEMYGVSRQTLRSWEKTIGLETEPNVAEIGEFATEGLAQHYIRHRYGEEPCGVFSIQSRVYKTLPNTYVWARTSILSTAPSVRRTGRAVRSALNEGDRANICHAKIFHYNPRTAYRNINTGRTDIAYVKTRARLGRATVWDRCV